MDTGEHGKHKPVLQSIYNTMKCTWAGLLEEKPVVHTGAILAKSIPNNDQVYERPMHQHKRSTEQNFLVSPEQQHQQSCE